MAVEFYNPGGRIFAKLAFDHPVNDIKRQNTISYYDVDAEEKSFFEVPTEIEIETVNGMQAVAVRFADRIEKDYREFGVIRIDPKRDLKRKPIGEADNVVLDRKDAKAKGERLWRECMLSLVREHKRVCDEVRHAGMMPSRAKGNVAHALKTLGIEDPANDVADVLKRSEDTSDVAKLRKELDELKTALLKK